MRCKSQPGGNIGKCSGRGDVGSGLPVPDISEGVPMAMSSPVHWSPQVCRPQFSGIHQVLRIHHLEEL